MKQYALAFVLSLILATPIGGDLQVEVLGLSKDRAFLSVNGRQHIFRAGGKSIDGLRLVSASPIEAVVDYGGQTFNLALSRRVGTHYSNNTQARSRQPATQLASGITVRRDERGRFLVPGRINGFDRKLLVDTGASLVAMSSQHADTLGIDTTGARVRMGQSASGAMPYKVVTLDEIDISGMRVTNVQAAVIEGDYPREILLGMSYLQHVGMQQQGSVLKLIPSS